MRLQLVQLDMYWPKELPCDQLRAWILTKLQKHGEPLRWSLSEVQESLDHDYLCELRVEAVVIVENFTPGKCDATV